jgi:hypothetical protein
MRKRKRFQSSGEYQSFIELPINISWEATPPEPDVNWPGSLEITSVLFSKVELIGYLSDQHIEEMQREVQEHLDGMNDPDALGDYLYDLRKDEGL